MGQPKRPQLLDITCFGSCSETKRTQTKHEVVQFFNMYFYRCLRCKTQMTAAERKPLWNKYL